MIESMEDIKQKAKLWDALISAGGTHRVTIVINDKASDHQGIVSEAKQLVGYLESKR